MNQEDANAFASRLMSYYRGGEEPRPPEVVRVEEMLADLSAEIVEIRKGSRAPLLRGQPDAARQVESTPDSGLALALQVVDRHGHAPQKLHGEPRSRSRDALPQRRPNTVPHGRTLDGSRRVDALLAELRRGTQRPGSTPGVVRTVEGETMRQGAEAVISQFGSALQGEPPI